MSLHLKTFGGLSLERDGQPLTGPGSHRSVLALAAVLARAGRRGVSRESVAALLWPESDAERARNALRQALYHLRSEAGEAAVVGTHQLVLHPGAVHSDVAEFEAALARDDLARAIAVHAGPFLDGFFLRGSPEFDQWTDRERAELRRGYRAALEELARRAEAEGDLAGAVGFWRRRAADEPISSRVAMRLMRALIAAGDQPGALQAARVHVAGVRQELGCDPDPRIIALADELAHAQPAPHARADPPYPDSVSPRRPAASGPGTPRPPQVAAAPPIAPKREGRRKRVLAVAAAAGVLGGALAFASGGGPAPAERSQVVVAGFENLTGDSALDPVARIAADWIRQGLAQTGLVEVATMGVDAWLGVGRRPSRHDAVPGFTVSGVLYAEADSLVLRGTVTDHRSRQIGALDPVVTSADAPLAAVERLRQQVMALLATHLNEELTAWATAARQPTSFAAYQAFADGMEAYARGDLTAARDHFLRSSALDTTYSLPLLWAPFALDHLGPVSDSIIDVVLARRDRLTPLEAAVAEYNRAWRDLEPEAAYQATRRLTSIAPESEWLYLHGRMAHGTMRPHEAVATLLRADPGRGWLAGHASRGYWTTLASALKQTGQYERALETARRGRQEFPGDLTPLVLLEGAALAALGRVEELDSLWATLLFWDTPEARQDLPLAWPVGWAQELLAHGETAAGMRMLDRTMDVYRRMPAAMRAQLPKRMEYARMLWIAGRYAEAADSLAAMLEQHPGHSNLRLRHGMAAARAGAVETALRQLETLERSESPLKPYWRFCILAALGRNEEALVILRQYRYFRFHSWPGTHIDYAFPLMQEYPAFLSALAPRDGPPEPLGQ